MVLIKPPADVVNCCNPQPPNPFVSLSIPYILRIPFPSIKKLEPIVVKEGEVDSFLYKN